MKTHSVVFVLMLACACARTSHAQVSNEQLEHAGSTPQNWLTYSGDYSGKRYSGLQQVNTSNVSRLAPAWVFQSQVGGKFETTPLVIDGVMYFTSPDDHGYAVDARTGRVIWRYDRSLPARVPVCCGRVNRGFAALGESARADIRVRRLIMLVAIAAQKFPTTLTHPTLNQNNRNQFPCVT